ncbi:uncharacterized protein EI90DRAFT_3115794 [Cantharellus anzutake]|uniref:uncharacterized protein n=1 Tax=Cantharellus anzutake TaxID=1750568 RepID=UPI00190885AF|nr:uncharacterized protein EI90DRAFT_3115794 [Cantharellus anzutake]KAF8341977.1 hypothetical protein EI90DRAFT_3115794 [Cantharellus anzutake]
MSFSSSSKFVVLTSPLRSTFELPKEAYGDSAGLKSIQWDLAEGTSYESKTHGELIAELQETCSEFRSANEYVASAVSAIDATNAQLALCGMYALKARAQLLSHEKGDKHKEEGGRIKGTFGRVVTHSGFVQHQTDRFKRKMMEEELEKVMKEVQKDWEEFQRGQKACAAAWKEKERLQALKLRVPVISIPGHRLPVPPIPLV